MPNIQMTYTVDLANPIQVTRMNTLFAMGDNEAHKFTFFVVQDGKTVDLSGCTVAAEFTNFSPHSTTINLDGAIDGDKVVVLLKQACYTLSGRFALVVRLKQGEAKTCIFLGDGYMSRTEAETLIDGDYIVYDINTLLEKIAEINAATEAANTAAANADEKAAAADTATSNAIAATDNANDGADNANLAADKINGLTISATGIAAGSSPTADLSNVDGHYHIGLGIPKGDTGETPQISVEVTTGEAGSLASVSVTGTAENPVIHLTIPRGDMGSIGALTINGKSPDGAGKITLTAEDVGARASDWMPTASDVGALPSGGKAADASKLGGELPEYYIHHRNLVHNSNFRKFIAQSGIGDTHDVTQAYAGDRWILDSGTVTGEENENGEGYSNITLNGTIRQKIADAPDVATAKIGMISGEATIIYANGELTITSAGGVIDWVLLVEGENIPASYIPPEYSAELLKCQPYYFCIGSVGNYALPIALCIFSSTTSARIVVFLPTAMRVSPTVIYPGGELTISNGIEYKTITSLSVQGVRGNVLYISATGSGYTSKENGIVRFVGVTNEKHYIKFCSDL